MNELKRFIFILTVIFVISACSFKDNDQSEKIYNRIIVLKLIENTWKEDTLLLDGIPGGRDYDRNTVDWDRHPGY